MFYLLLKVSLKAAAALKLMSAIEPQSREKPEMSELSKTEDDCCIAFLNA